MTQDEEFISEKVYHIYVRKHNGLFSLASNVLYGDCKKAGMDVVELSIDQITGKIKIIYQKVKP